MLPSLNQRSPAHPRKLRHAVAGIGLVVLGAALGLIGGGLWLHARRKPPSGPASPFTLGTEPQLERAAHLRDEPLGLQRPRHD